MKVKYSILILLLFSNQLIAQKYIDKFDFQPNPIEQKRVAQPSQYFDKIGRKAAIMGSESGTFECWIWPWKVLRNFEFQFFLENSTQPISSKDIVRNISVTPELTRITYVYESFSITANIFVPYFEQGVIILLDVTTTRPLKIVPGIIPVMQPQWPAGIGGQYSYWDNELKAFVISASAQKTIFLCGSPAGEEMSNPPAHMLSDSPLQFCINVKPHEANHKFIPVVIAGGIDTKFDTVKTYYSGLIKNAESLYQKNYEYYQSLLNNTIQIITPDQRLNLAYSWGKIALHNLMVTNQKLGTGLVAGYGWSGTGGRPGFAWYFGGDAFINCLSFNDVQDFQTSKDALSFTQKWQRQDNFPIRKKNPKDNPVDIGKMAHELSQSDGIIDWWNDYHYGYNHADTSPWYIVAMGDYFNQSGDVDFIKKSWNSIIQAYRWCLSKDSNNDGLMDLKGAGLGVLEFGSLVKIYNDHYTQGIWTQALKEIINMSEQVGDQKINQEAKSLLPKALSSLEKLYWMQDLGFYSFGADEKGSQVREKTPNMAVSMMFGLLDTTKTNQTLKQLNEPDLTTDWGIRMLSDRSTFYDPANYNYGAIWNFTNLYLNTAQFRYGNTLPAVSNLNKAVQKAFDYGLGVCPEVYSGDINYKLAEAYHDHGFSTSGYMVPFVRGLAGLSVDAVHNKISFHPQLPAEWESLIIKNISLKGRKINLSLTKINNMLRLFVENTSMEAVSVEFEPIISSGTEIYKTVIVDNTGKESILQTKSIKLESSIGVFSEFQVKKTAEIKFFYKPLVEIYWLPYDLPLGVTNSGIKVISINSDDKSIILETYGIEGKSYYLGIKNPELISTVEGAKVSGDKLLIEVPNSKIDGFIKHLVTINLKHN